MLALFVKIPRMKRLLRKIRSFSADSKYSADDISLIRLPCHISASPHFTLPLHPLADDCSKQQQLNLITKKA